MESLGNLLKTLRENKGYTLDFVSQETNIAKRYLEALEMEEFDVFPGEPYALGFLKNYGAYLDLDSNEILSLYRAMKIREQPLPIDQILKSPSQAPKILGTIAVILVILGLAGLGVWFFTTKFNISPKLADNPPVRTPVEYTLNTGTLERRFYRGDTIVITLEAETYKLELSGLGETVTLTTPVGPLRLDLSQEATIDLNEDGFAELRIIVTDFAKNDSNAGALLSVELESPPPSVQIAQQQELPTELVSSSTANTVIFSSPNPYPFTLQAGFQGYCLFRWEILFEQNRRGRNEQYFQQSDELNIQAQNGIRIGLSNAHAVKLQVIGGGRTVALEIGGPGEVIVADIRWFRDEENRYRLMLARLE